MAKVFVKCGSHRARDRLTMLLDVEKMPCYWSFRHPAKGGYFKIPEERLAEARKIPGVTKATNPQELSPCWSW
jgi:hypothetical protein